MCNLDKKLSNKKHDYYNFIIFNVYEESYDNLVVYLHVIIVAKKNSIGQLYRCIKNC